MMRPTYGGMPVLVSSALPLRPSPGEWARRFVRHGMADMLEWLGEEVGPKPDDLTHVVLGFDPAGQYDRRTQAHLCSEVAGVGTDAQEPAMEITCPLCQLVLERGQS